jgi:hypothetical protein
LCINCHTWFKKILGPFFNQKGGPLAKKIAIFFPTRYDILCTNRKPWSSLVEYYYF